MTLVTIFKKTIKFVRLPNHYILTHREASIVVLSRDEGHNLLYIYERKGTDCRSRQNI